jgi:hypothetical protein
MSQTIQESTPLVAELVGLFFITVLFTGLIVFTDIRIFDSYVGLSIEVCFPANQENFCMLIREALDLAPDAQIEIGNAYWQLLGIQMIVIPLGFGAFRLLTIIVRKRKLTGLRIFVVLLWILVPASLLMFGIIDTFYYLGRGLEIPDQLEWLNNVGVFQITAQLGNDPVNVERSDLLFTFALGVIFIILLFFTAIKLYENSRLKGFV